MRIDLAKFGIRESEYEIPGEFHLGLPWPAKYLPCMKIKTRFNILSKEKET